VIHGPALADGGWVYDQLFERLSTLAEDGTVVTRVALPPAAFHSLADNIGVEFAAEEFSLWGVRVTEDRDLRSTKAKATSVYGLKLTIDLAEGNHHD
jgi:hypothetical protein